MTIEQAQRDFDELIAKNGFTLAGHQRHRLPHLPQGMENDSTGRMVRRTR